LRIFSKILKSALSNESNLKVFGNDYPTPDGTCVRDYVHVTDLAQAHLLGLEYMQKNEGFSAFNLGNGDGFSVLEVIKSCEYISNNEIDFLIDGRREGDPAVLVADNKLAVQELNWNPEYCDINDIIKSAWSWHENEEY
jgi:UDP-glucose 4-epimerase